MRMDSGRRLLTVCVEAYLLPWRKAIKAAFVSYVTNVESRWMCGFVRNAMWSWVMLSFPLMWNEDGTMTKIEPAEGSEAAGIPEDDLTRELVHVSADDAGIPHLGVVGDTYTMLLAAKDTAGRYCLVDMHVPPGGGPPPHRHDFEETFIVLEGEIEATFRGKTVAVKAGETIHIPANAPHQFRNAGDRAARMVCICSPAGQEEMFVEIGVKVGSRTEAPPKLDQASQKVMMMKAEALAPKYKTELLGQA
jgi:quercetin dioxygenase-like cupin family protein